MSWSVVAVVGASLLVLALIVWPISKRIRAETGMDPDLTAALLLGEPVPDDAARSRAEITSERYRDFDPGEIRALRQIGEPEPVRKRSKRK